jgi:N-acetylmuramoyl-L-alanine amidase
MTVEHKVKQGDCISSIAEKYGLFWEKVWNHSNNAELKDKRKDPNVLYPGDVVFVPDKEDKEESCSTEQRHRFRAKGVPALVRLVLVDDESEPRKDEPYILEIDGELYSGTTDNDGKIEHRIRPNAREGKLLFGAEGEEEYLLQLGNLDPVEEISGVQERLQNLGFDCGKIDGHMGAKTESALRAFQKKYQLQVTGQPDEATRQKLKGLHES